MGAATDAEAARNVQSRLEQDAAASQVVASMNRGAEAMRDARAAKLGIGRGTLDQMEGRMDSPNIQRSAPEAPTPPGVFDRPGDGFGDAGMRQAKFEGFLSDAANAKGWGSGKRRAANLAAAEKLLAVGQAGVEQDTANRKTMAEQQSAQQSALAALQGRQMQEAGEDRRADLNARTQLGSAALAQRGGIAKEELQQSGLTNRDAAKNYGDMQKEITRLQEKAFYGKEKELDITDFKSTLDGLDEGELVSTGMVDSVEHARDLKAGKFRSPGEFQRALAAAKARKAGQPGWFKSFFSEGPNATSLYTGR